MSTTSEALAIWETSRNVTISEAENIPEERCDFRPGEGARTVRDLVRHILESGVGFARELTSDQPTFARVFAPETRAQFTATYPENSSKNEVIEQLRKSFADDMQRLRDQGDLAAQTMTLMKREQTRLTGLWFSISHEMYHRGQLATYARAIGLVPAMTQQSQARRS